VSGLALDVSVVIPTYNRGHLITRAIQSVLGQTHQVFEIIVVDDSSTDNTGEVVKAIGSERIRYIRHTENRGGSAARNTGIEAAKCDYIAFQDSDDEWLPQKLEKQMTAFGSAPQEVGVVYTGFWRIENNRRTYMPSRRIRQKEGNIHLSLLRRSFITTQAAVVRRECFRKAGGFDESLPRLQDWELWIRISKHYLFRLVDEPLVVSYYTPDSISSDRIALARAHKLVLEKHFEEIKKDRKLLAKRYLGIGDLLCSERAMKEGRSYLVKAIAAYPLNARALLAAYISLFGATAYDQSVRGFRKIQSLRTSLFGESSSK